MRIIPAIDIIEGQCVRLSQGDYQSKKVYANDPLELAKELEGAGIKYLHLVDLDGAKAGHPMNLQTLERITAKTNLIVDFGGGLRKENQVQDAFNAGANQITGGSIAVKDPQQFSDWLRLFGEEKIILGADARDQKIATDGWLQSSNLNLLDFLAAYQDQGVQYAICTDIEKDGMLAGPAISLYQEILNKTSLKLIASGGITSIDDLKNLQDLGCEGAIIGKALYEGRITLKELSHLC